MLKELKEQEQQQDIEFDVVDYTKNPLSRGDLERLLRLLPNEPSDLVRRDKRFSELGLTEDEIDSAEAVVELLLAHPALMQRPVAVRGLKAVLARPAETLLELL